MERRPDPLLGIEVDHEVTALLLRAVGDERGHVGAGHLWDALPTDGMPGALGVPADARPDVPVPDHVTEESLARVGLKESGVQAFRLARFLADEHEDAEVRLRHVAIALAGLPDPRGRSHLMQRTAVAVLGAEILGLEGVLNHFLSTAGGEQESRPRRLPGARWRARRAWKRRFRETVQLHARGDMYEAARSAAELVLAADEVMPRAADLARVCEMGADAAAEAGNDEASSLWFCQRGLVVCESLDEPRRSMSRVSLLQELAVVSFNRGDYAASEAYIRAGDAALAAYEEHRSVRRNPARELGPGPRLTAAEVLHGLGRWDEALERAEAARACAEEYTDRGDVAVALTSIGGLLMEVGDERRLTEVADQLSSVDPAADLGSLHPSARVNVLRQVTELRVWLCERRGDPAGAIQLLKQADAALLAEPGWHSTVEGIVRIQELLAAVHLRNKDDGSARRVLDFLGPDDMLEVHPRGGLLAVWLDYLQLTQDRQRVLATMRNFDRRHGNDALSPQRTVAILPAVAASAAAVGEPAEALGYLERITAAMALVSGGRLPAGIRRTVLETRVSARDTCLRTVAAVAQLDPRRAAQVALQCADTWRETTLAGAVGADLGPLPAAVRDLIEQIERATAATEGGEQASGGLRLAGTDTDGATPSATRVAELREELGQAIGVSLAQLLVPAPRSAPLIATGEQEALLSVTAFDGRPGDGTVHLVASWQLPDGSAGVREAPIGPAAVTLLRQLAAGLSFDGLDDLEDWHDAWEEVAAELAAAILPGPLRTWLADGSALTIRYALDGMLGNLPLIALPLGDGRRVVDVAAVNRVPFLRAVERSGRPSPAPPRVLAYLYGTEGAATERRRLEHLDRAGRIELHLSPSLGDVLPLLSGGEFDVLILSCHGSGSGLGFRFHDDAPSGEQLFAHQLLDVRVPPLVVAASCFSGAEGAVDITGVLATLISRGAESVVAGSWALPDEDTAELLTAFYDLLDAPGTVAQRLRAAQAASAGEARQVPSWAGLTCTTL